VIPFGLCVWSTGVGPTPFITSLPFAKTTAGRLAVDRCVRVRIWLGAHRATGDGLGRESQDVRSKSVAISKCVKGREGCMAAPLAKRPPPRGITPPDTCPRYCRQDRQDRQMDKCVRARVRAGGGAAPTAVGRADGHDGCFRVRDAQTAIMHKLFRGPHTASRTKCPGPHAPRASRTNCSGGHTPPPCCTNCSGAHTPRAPRQKLFRVSAQPLPGPKHPGPLVTPLLSPTHPYDYKTPTPVSAQSNSAKVCFMAAGCECLGVGSEVSGQLYFNSEWGSGSERRGAASRSYGSFTFVEGLAFRRHALMSPCAFGGGPFGCATRTDPLDPAPSRAHPLMGAFDTSWVLGVHFLTESHARLVPILVPCAMTVPRAMRGAVRAHAPWHPQT
jgi:hypothetical protein